MSTTSPAETSKLNFQTDALMVGIGCTVYFLGAKLVWFHYFIFIIPLAIFLTRAQCCTSTKAIKVRCLLVGIAIIAIASKSIIMALQTTRPQSVAIVCLGTLILYAIALSDVIKGKATGSSKDCY